MTPPGSELRRVRSLIADLDGIVWEADAANLSFSFVSEGAQKSGSARTAGRSTRSTASVRATARTSGSATSATRCVTSTASRS